MKIGGGYEEAVDGNCCATGCGAIAAEDAEEAAANSNGRWKGAAAWKGRNGNADEADEGNADGAIEGKGGGDDGTR